MDAGRPRFSLGILMVYIALVAIILNPMRAPWFQLATTIPYVIGECAEVAILLGYRRLSRWFWVLLASKVCRAIGQSLFENTFGVQGRYEYLIPLWLGYLLSVLGLAMASRDIARRLAETEKRAIPTPEVESIG